MKILIFMFILLFVLVIFIIREIINIQVKIYTEEISQLKDEILMLKCKPKDTADAK